MRYLDGVSWFRTTGLALAMGVWMGCGPIFPLTADPSIPFAQGQVQATFGDDGKVDLDLTTEHMGDPGKLDPAATVYVVWITEKGGQPRNVGSFRPNPALKGWVGFSTQARSFEVKVTVEPTPDAERPTGRALLRGEVSG